MYKAIIVPLAKEDIRSTAKWYNQQQKGLGIRFTKEVRKKVAHICKNPENIATRYKDVKTAIVDVFPYMIHFVVVEENKTIVISAVFAMAQSPQNWQTRK